MHVTGVTIYHEKLDIVFPLQLRRIKDKDGKITEEFWRMVCPECQGLGKLDADQFAGRVSIQCECGFHKTINFLKIIKETL